MEPIKVAFCDLQNAVERRDRYLCYDLRTGRSTGTGRGGDGVATILSLIARFVQSHVCMHASDRKHVRDRSCFGGRKLAYILISICCGTYLMYVMSENAGLVMYVIASQMYDTMLT